MQASNNTAFGDNKCQSSVPWYHQWGPVSTLARAMQPPGKQHLPALTGGRAGALSTIVITQGILCPPCA